MRMLLVLLSAGAIASPAFAAEGDHRELGPHEHGVGNLNIAVEGTKVSMELEVPGMDIVGFEYAAKTAKQKAAVEKAKKQLLAPLAIFKFPAAANCATQQTNVAIESEDHDHDHAKGDKGGEDGAKAADAREGHEEHEHSEFHVEYTLECKAPDKITAIEFGYFRAFTSARKLNINLITPKGQSKFEATRDKPRIDLAGMM
jgi:Protein of unknown function (DUF2796)